MDNGEQLHSSWRGESQGDHGYQSGTGCPGSVVWLGWIEMEPIPPLLPSIPEERKNTPGCPSDSLWQQRPGTGEERRAGHNDEEGLATPTAGVPKHEVGVLPAHPKTPVALCN